MDVDGVLAEQVAYYRARADQYDDWWERRHDYDEGPEFAAAWRRDVGELRAWLDGHGPLGHVLELAAGTGNWTAELAARGASVTAVDASPEVLRINASKLAATGVPVTYVVDDVFEWTPPRRFDTVFFAFWLSHVPEPRWTRFWATVDRALAPGGRVLFCDNAAPERVATRGPARRSPGVTDRDGEGAHGESVRRLRDGARFTIIKRYWTPEQLVDELAPLGWDATCGETTFAFLHGSARRTG